MKICRNCSQAVAEEITACPLCGADVGPKRKYIDDCRVLLDLFQNIKNKRPLDFRSDIWSLGVVFLELLTAYLRPKRIF